jgi:Putative adhesin
MLTSRPIRLALLLVPLLPTTAFAWDDCKFTAERTASVDTSGAARIEIAARAGDLALRKSSTKMLAANGRACASSEEILSQINVQARRNGDVVRVYVEVPDPLEGIGNVYALLHLGIAVPTGIPVTLTDSSGDMTIDDVQVERLTDSSGDITARNLPADVEIGDSSGDIRIENATGRVQITDSSGDIVVKGAREVVIPSDSSGSIRITRVSGDVRIDNDSSGDVSVADIGGAFELVVDSSGDVTVSDVRGQVTLPEND